MVVGWRGSENGWWDGGKVRIVGKGLCISYRPLPLKNLRRSDYEMKPCGT